MCRRRRWQIAAAVNCNLTFAFILKMTQHAHCQAPTHEQINFYDWNELKKWKRHGSFDAELLRLLLEANYFILFLCAPYMYQSDRVLCKRFESKNDNIEMTSRWHSHASRRFKWESNWKRRNNWNYSHMHTFLRCNFLHFHRKTFTNSVPSDPIKHNKKKKKKIIFRFLESKRFNCFNIFLQLPFLRFVRRMRLRTWRVISFVSIHIANINKILPIFPIIELNWQKVEERFP